MPNNRTVLDLIELKATQLREAAEALPDGEEREGLLFRARRIQRACLIIDRWTL
jgi:hypothetical protein